VADKKKLTTGTNPLADIDDGLLKNYRRPSNDLIYESIMRGGGEPFGQPFEAGVSSLTDKIVKLFKQHSFFAFETMEKPRKKARSNKFTKYGAAPFKGGYRRKP